MQFGGSATPPLRFQALGVNAVQYWLCTLNPNPSAEMPAADVGSPNVRRVHVQGTWRAAGWQLPGGCLSRVHGQWSRLPHAQQRSKKDACNQTQFSTLNSKP